MREFKEELEAMREFTDDRLWNVGVGVVLGVGVWEQCESWAV